MDIVYKDMGEQFSLKDKSINDYIENDINKLLCDGNEVYFGMDYRIKSDYFDYGFFSITSNYETDKDITYDYELNYNGGKSFDDDGFDYNVDYKPSVNIMDTLFNMKPNHTIHFDMIDEFYNVDITLLDVYINIDNFVKEYVMD